MMTSGSRFRKAQVKECTSLGEGRAAVCLTCRFLPHFRKGSVRLVPHPKWASPQAKRLKYLRKRQGTVDASA